MNEATTARPRWRFLLTPKWIMFHLIVLTAVIAMVNLGFWQLRRLDERRAFNATVTERIEQSPVPLESLLPTETVQADGGDGFDDLEWRAVVVDGSFVGGEDIEIVNKSYNGGPGSHELSPLRLTDGRLVLINRGFVPLTSTAPPPPDGAVNIVGVLRRSQTRSGLGLRDPEEGELTSAHRVDIARLAPQLDAPVVPMYVEIVDRWPNDGLDANGGADDGADGSPVPLHLPELSEGNHLSYAGQWFIFSVAVAVGWVLAVRRSLRNHNAGR